jgi:PTH1 family peptidyl-tRNA hydrolase
MKLIVGLGNPGSQYAKTRHNIGFIVIDDLAQRLSASDWKLDKKLEAELAEVQIEDEKVLLAKPQTYMNDSGRSVRKIMNFYKDKMSADQLWVIHDDIDLEVNAILIKIGGSAGGQKGVQSIIDTLGTPDFHRIRVGIGRNNRVREPSEMYVMKAH